VVIFYFVGQGHCYYMNPYVHKNRERKRGEFSFPSPFLLHEKAQ